LQADHFVNVTSMLRRLYNRLAHPHPYQRLGATMALYQLYPVLRQQKGIVDRHVFELFFYCAKSLRLAEADAETIGRFAYCAFGLLLLGNPCFLALDLVNGTPSSYSLLCKEPAAGKSGRGTVGSSLRYWVFISLYTSKLNYPCCEFGEGHIFESFNSANNLKAAEADPETTGGLASHWLVLSFDGWERIFVVLNSAMSTSLSYSSIVERGSVSC
jgi:hypothetical protein